MENQLNTGKLETLKTNETLLVSARKVSGDKIHLEFREVLENGSSSKSILSILNQSDDRFSSSARAAWVTAEPLDAKNVFNVDFGPTANWYMSDKGEMLDLNILNPTIEGERVRIQIMETTEPTQWQSENIETSAKRRGKDGDYITHQGAYIFSNTIVVKESTFDGHQLLEADTATQTQQQTQVEELESMI
jgi:hypothetical protein